MFIPYSICCARISPLPLPPLPHHPHIAELSLCTRCWRCCVCMCVCALCKVQHLTFFSSFSLFFFYIMLMRSLFVYRMVLADLTVRTHLLFTTKACSRMCKLERMPARPAGRVQVSSRVCVVSAATRDQKTWAWKNQSITDSLSLFSLSSRIRIPKIALPHVTAPLHTYTHTHSQT